MMAEVLHRLGHVHALVFTGPDGVDELGVARRRALLRGDRRRRSRFHPRPARRRARGGAARRRAGRRTRPPTQRPSDPSSTVSVGRGVTSWCSTRRRCWSRPTTSRRFSTASPSPPIRSTPARRGAHWKPWLACPTRWPREPCVGAAQPPADRRSHRHTHVRYRQRRRRRSGVILSSIACVPRRPRRRRSTERAARARGSRSSTRRHCRRAFASWTAGSTAAPCATRPS